jgi:hypothetical protein
MTIRAVIRWTLLGLAAAAYLLQAHYHLLAQANRKPEHQWLSVSCITNADAFSELGLIHRRRSFLAGGAFAALLLLGLSV